MAAAVPGLVANCRGCSYLLHPFLSSLSFVGVFLFCFRRRLILLHRMVCFVGSVSSSCCPRVLFRNRTCRAIGRGEANPVLLSSFRHPRRDIGLLKTRIWRENHGGVAAAGSRSGRDPSFDPDLSPEEPFWLALIRELIWSLKSLFYFLCEQPSQLKYIEWPSFQSTLKTATLTLVLVALLIVALTSVDTVLSYVSRFLLRKSA